MNRPPSSLNKPLSFLSRTVTRPTTAETSRELAPTHCRSGARVAEKESGFSLHVLDQAGNAVVRRAARINHCIDRVSGGTENWLHPSREFEIAAERSWQSARSRCVLN